MLNAIFLDLLDQDAYRVTALSELLEPLPTEKRGSLRPVRLLTIRPSRDLGRMAAASEPDLPPAFRFLTRGLGTTETRSPDLLSFLLFDPGYLHQLIALGEEDGRAQVQEFRALVAGHPGRNPTSVQG
jgi:NTE family protein